MRFVPPESSQQGHPDNEDGLRLEPESVDGSQIARTELRGGGCLVRPEISGRCLFSVILGHFSDFHGATGVLFVRVEWYHEVHLGPY